jgi:large subunit ribosomal protein L18
MSNEAEKLGSRKKRASRVRYKLRLNSDRPRLSVFRSNRHIYAQIVDDGSGATLVCASTLDKEFRRKPGDRFNADLAREVGKRLAERAIQKNILKVVLDRGPYLYHGKVRALADGAREGGLVF